MKQLSDLTRLARRFDVRPILMPKPKPKFNTFIKTPANIQNCLDYVRCFIRSEEQIERNGDIRFLGQGGLLVTADGRGWYSFSEETGGGLPELIAWHHQQALIGEGS
ncbi:MAG: hypothetical protein GY942_14420 [Aestuariibacter sp.]|nr:hypothetical protein [Aestuariibacter sp.]